MTDSNKRAKKDKGIMDLKDDVLVGEIIARLPLKQAIQCLAVDYPNPNQYKVVTISYPAENSNSFYKFHVLSSERPGLWREIQLTANTSISLSFGSPPVYWRNSLHWLRSDGSVLAFDTKKEEAMLIDRPWFLDHYDVNCSKIPTGRDVWLGIAQGLLTVVYIFKETIVIGTYDNVRSTWRIRHTFDNLISGSKGMIDVFPIWNDSKHVCFLVDRPLTGYYDLREYDTETSGYKKTAELGRTIVNCPIHCFQLTLASVHKTPSDGVETDDLAYITAKLDEIRRFIIDVALQFITTWEVTKLTSRKKDEQSIPSAGLYRSREAWLHKKVVFGSIQSPLRPGIGIQEESSSSSSSSSSSEHEEEAEQGEQEEEGQEEEDQN
ncbi:hypothetical protein CQW23_08094 [Capsicum baccatum]|uniref:Uncharacterized protein n=1 Tax=Capsicum baccatum TaxID=33114 RepID=A0A2G2X7Y5_CAPBA|nr:hypothetical protein CQW23_08094 [Capsicum baccatum]